VTVLYSVGLVIVHFVLGEPTAAGAVVRGLVPALLMNLALAAVVYAAVRRLLRQAGSGELSTEVQLLG
jgi:hypothetical protein